MTALRQSAIMELEKLPEDKLGFIIQIMQGVNGLYTNTKSERKSLYWLICCSFRNYILQAR